MSLNETQTYWLELTRSKAGTTGWKAQVRQMSGGSVDFLFGGVLLASLKVEKDHTDVFRMLPIDNARRSESIKFPNTYVLAVATAVLPDILDSLLPSIPEFRTTQNITGRQN